jgi:peptidylprolyl isomerase/FKBP-type peptidyl-prolyl cis-trans isomerase FklB
MSRLLIVCLLAVSLAACNKPGGGEAGRPTAAALAEGKAYMSKNATAPGVKTTPSGLQYKVLSSGPETGVHPKASDEVKVNYEGKLIDGTIFDSSYKDGTPITFILNQVVPGWTEALQLMRPGDVWEITLPPELGYGEQDKGPIPANSTLIFKVELLDVFPHPG